MCSARLISRCRRRICAVSLRRYPPVRSLVRATTKHKCACWIANEPRKPHAKDWQKPRLAIQRDACTKEMGSAQAAKSPTHRLRIEFSRYFLTISIEACVVSHSNFKVHPAPPLSSAMVKFSTGAGSFDGGCISTRKKSDPSGYGTPHSPVFL